MMQFIMNKNTDIAISSSEIQLSKSVGAFFDVFTIKIELTEDTYCSRQVIYIPLAYRSGKPTEEYKSRDLSYVQGLISTVTIYKTTGVNFMLELLEIPSPSIFKNTSNIMMDREKRVIYLHYPLSCLIDPLKYDIHALRIRDCTIMYTKSCRINAGNLIKGHPYRIG